MGVIVERWRRRRGQEDKQEEKREKMINDKKKIDGMKVRQVTSRNFDREKREGRKDSFRSADGTVRCIPNTTRGQSLQ